MAATCKCTDEMIHKGQSCSRTEGLPNPADRCTWCREGHPGASGS